MKKFLTNNIGLKILSLIAATAMWLVVVNIDDPVISRTYSGIPVEVINGDAVTAENMTYEVLDESDVISVIVSAKRSVIEQMSKDYIRATADMMEISQMDTVPIEVKSIRFSDRIESITAKTKNLKVQVENLEKKQVAITVIPQGSVSAGHVLGDVVPSVNVLTVSGPESVIKTIAAARAEIDVSDMSEDLSTVSYVHLYDANGDIVTNPLISCSIAEVHVDAQVLTTKEISLIAAFSGTPADGYGTTGGIEIDPSTVLVAGKSKDIDNLTHIAIPESALSVSGASGNVVKIVNLSGYLPEGVRMASIDMTNEATVTIYVEKLQSMDIEVPISNISITNIPEGYSPYLVDIGTPRTVTVTGIANVLNQLDPTTITGTIDAMKLVPRVVGPEQLEEGTVYAGLNDGIVSFQCPAGVNVTSSLVMEVVMNVTDASGNVEVPAAETAYASFSQDVSDINTNENAIVTSPEDITAGAGAE